MPGFVRPNVILVYVDQHSSDAISINRNTGVQTPALIQLAAHGAWCTHCFTQHLDGASAFYGTMSGRYHRLANAAAPLWPAILHSYGYDTGIFGMLPPGASAADIASFDHAETFTQLGGDDAYSAFLRDVSPATLLRLHTALERQGPPAKGQPDPDCLDIALTPSAFALNRTTAFIEQSVRAGRPFFCTMAASAFDFPRIMPQQFLEKYDPEQLAMPPLPPDPGGAGTSPVTAADSGRRCQAWYAAISEIDHRLGTLLGLLHQLEIAQNTLVIYTGARGIRGQQLTDSPGLCVPDYACRVPLLLRGIPDLIRPGKIPCGIAEGIDLLPTVLDLLALPIPAEVQGRSFRPMLDGRSVAHRDSAITELPGRRFLRTNFFRYGIDRHSTEALYDLTQPEGQFRNVLADLRYRNSAMDHRLRLLTHMLQQG